jgi:ArsR family transcriptional regulator
MRLRLLALAAEEELSVGELAELLGEPQPNVSRHAAPLRQAALLADRRQGARTLVRLADNVESDPVIADALAAGRKLCDEDGSLARVSEVVSARDQKTREFFERPPAVEVALSPDLPSYLWAFAGLIESRGLAVDVGTGDGVLLDLLAPIYERVVAVDRSEAQLSRARQRIKAHGYDNVELIEAPIGGEAITKAVGKGADLVVAARVLHHAPRPKSALADLADLVRPGGKLLVIDYARHEDDQMSEKQADVWLGFSKSELRAFAAAAKLSDIHVRELPSGFVRSGPDSHIQWLTLLATRGAKQASQSKEKS